LKSQKKNNSGYSVYQNIEEVSKLIPQSKSFEQMHIALFKGPDTPYANVPSWRPGLCRGIRVIIRYSEMKKSLEFCNMLSKKGYKVFVQPMVTMRYSITELEYLIEECNKFKAFALYIVDSYGYMTSADIFRIFKIYDEKLRISINIGLHAHNNMNLAFSNSLFFLEQNTKRQLIVDSTIIGMGQGAGNTQTELIASYLNKFSNYKYKIKYILNACEIIEKFNKNHLWGYSVKNLLPAIHKSAYKYSASLKKKYNLNYNEIDKFLSIMPDKYRHAYSSENIKKNFNLITKIKQKQ
jgi:4-hydroxy 2-oxovalerate aldolase